MISIFFSYSHEDEELRNELEKHLKILVRQETISTWHDRRITAGSEVQKEISENLKQANIILLLVSPDFLASDYCWKREMAFAIDRHNKGEAIVIPIILRPCNWIGAPFNNLLILPRDGKPVVKHTPYDDAFTEISKVIEQLIKDKFTKPQPPNVRKEPSRSQPSISSINESLWEKIYIPIAFEPIFDIDNYGQADELNKAYSLFEDSIDIAIHKFIYDIIFNKKLLAVKKIVITLFLMKASFTVFLQILIKKTAFMKLSFVNRQMN